MKKYGFIFILLLLAVIVSACANAATLVPAEDMFSTIYTAVALTLTPLASLVESVEISGPVSGLTPIATLTQIPATPTFQILNTPTFGYTGGCDNSKYVGDVSIPDGTKVVPGETFVKTWMLENNGSCTWSSNYSLTFYSGDGMNGEETTIDQFVPSGKQAEISVLLTAPDTEGTYIGYWIMSNDERVAFGEPVYVQIVVSDDALTNTPTPTPTSTPTPTNTPVSTATPSSTVSPTPTGSATPIPTGTPTFIPTFTSTPEDSGSSD